MIIDKITKEDLREFLDLCTDALGVDCSKYYDLTIQDIKYYRATKEERLNLIQSQALENKWYASLEKGEPDYTIYDDLDMLPNIWACWQLYSRDYLRKLMSNKALYGKNGTTGGSIIEDVGNPEVIVDLGCGIGYTTAALSELFPRAEVYGTNLKNSFQWKIGNRIAKDNYFEMVSDIVHIGKVDLIFASEYFEHFERPVKHLLYILKTEPKTLIIANAFTAKSPGHFNTYYDLNKAYDGKGISKLFNNTLRDYNYEMVKTNCWNNRPVYWKLKQQ